jgi:hypothetical protein
MRAKDCVAAVRGVARPPEFSAQGRQATAVGGIIPMRHGQVSGKKRAQSPFRRFLGDAFIQHAQRVLDRPSAGLGHQLILGREVFVEAAMRKAGRAHQPRQAGRRNAVAAEFLSRRGDNAFARAGRFFAGFTHIRVLQKSLDN